MALAYEKLPDHIKTQIAGLRARHSIEARFGAAMPIEKRLALKAQFPDPEHPVVRNAPGNRRENPVRQRLCHALHEFSYRRERPLRSGLRSGGRATSAVFDQPSADPGVSGSLPVEAEQCRVLG
jgi:hypothetical protein